MAKKPIIIINGFRLPVVQPTYEISEMQNNQLIEVVNFGEVSLKGLRKLKTFNYSSFYPATYDSSYCQFRNLKKPMSFINSLLKKKEEGEPVNFQFNKYGIDGEWVIDSLQYNSGDSTEDIYYSISMHEHVIPLKPYTSYVYSLFDTSFRRSATKTITSYITVPNDTIITISNKTGINTIELYNYNQAVLSPYMSPRLTIPAGLTIAIPGVA